MQSAKKRIIVLYAVCPPYNWYAVTLMKRGEGFRDERGIESGA